MRTACFAAAHQRLVRQRRISLEVFAVGWALAGLGLHLFVAALVVARS